jgi:hypothetical protein
MINLSKSIDPIKLISGYIKNKREKEEVHKLLSRFYKIETKNNSYFGKLLNIKNIGQNSIIVIESEDSINQIPFTTIRNFEEIDEKEYFLPFKLEELISLSKTRKETSLNFLFRFITSVNPVKKSVKNWFEEEIELLHKQIDNLIDLFPHRSYREWKEETLEIKNDFHNSMKEMDKVLKLVEEGEINKIEDIYPQQKNIPSITKNSPNILSAYTGLFTAALKLENMIEKVDSVIVNIQDTITITRIQHFISDY